MIDATIYVSSHFGRTIRVLLETCDGDPLLQADVTSMRYSIERKTFSGRSAVTGHTNVNIPVGKLSNTILTADNGESYNLEFYLDPTNKPFPQAGGAIYALIIGVTLASDGKEYGTEQELVTL